MKKKAAVLLLVVMTMLTIACQEPLEDRCSREAREYTKKNCPMRVAPNIVLDSMTFDKTTHTVSYCYTVQGILDNPTVFTTNTPRDLLLQQVRNETKLKLYKEAGYSFSYIYYSAQKKGTRLFEATFHQMDYK